MQSAGLLKVPAQTDLSDAATSIGSGASSRSSSPHAAAGAKVVKRVRFADEHQEVIVKSTFIELVDSPSMKERYNLMRKAKTDSVLLEVDSDSERDVYQPGKFSDEVLARQGDPVQVPGEVNDTLQTPVVAERRTGDSQRSDMPLPPPHGRANSKDLSVAAALPTEKQNYEDAGKRKQNSLEPTTVMMRNIPNNYTRDMFLAMLNGQGFMGRYDFIYLPCDFERNANLGYAFVNLVDSQTVDAFWKVFDNFSDWELPTAKVCQVKWSGPHQGLAAHLERYRNSPVMHKSVPDEYKPMLFADGVRLPFPAPTKRIKAPSKASSR
eukprot:TRINITY_DN76746_c0_g1_i1.p1 TRINITY_DN76746_c0_g1~~TRINITY_DN76746_c0_g1_i1.p1  ORF type:complete len:350 (+),score=76.64 TRINITY_DN76746_c0_g1_i1:83-1051(+)